MKTCASRRAQFERPIGSLKGVGMMQGQRHISVGLRGFTEIRSRRLDFINETEATHEEKEQKWGTSCQFAFGSKWELLPPIRLRELSRHHVVAIWPVPRYHTLKPMPHCRTPKLALKPVLWWHSKN